MAESTNVRTPAVPDLLVIHPNRPQNPSDSKHPSTIPIDEPVPRLGYPNPPETLAHREEHCMEP